MAHNVEPTISPLFDTQIRNTASDLKLTGERESWSLVEGILE